MTRKTLYFDSGKCVGCHACAVACMDQNDIDVEAGQPPLRQVAHVERLDAGEVRISHVSLACMHCEGAECLDACPAGARHVLIYCRRKGNGPSPRMSAFMDFWAERGVDIWDLNDQ